MKADDIKGASLFPCFAVVELFGRISIAGYCTLEPIGDSAFIRVDVPETKNQKAFTKVFSTSAVYGITPVTEDGMKIAAGNSNYRPVESWLVPDQKPQKRTITIDDRNIPEDLNKILKSIVSASFSQDHTVKYVTEQPDPDAMPDDPDDDPIDDEFSGDFSGDDDYE